MRSTLRLFASAVFLLALMLFDTPAAAQGRPPNIVIIVVDDMGYSDIGAYGSKDIPTPNVDALAAGGIKFTDAYVSAPVCSPTRAGLLTGRYQQRFGHEFNVEMVPAHSDVGLPIDEITIAERLQAAGYRTALFGKWHLGSAPRFRPMRRGFDEFFGFLAGSHSYFDREADINPLYDGNGIVSDTTYLTEQLADHAVDFITRRRSQPFFLYLAFNAPHPPLEATEKYLARFPGITNSRRRTYAAMISAMDDGIGRTLEALRTQGLEQNTLIFFFSDNGGLPSGFSGSSNAPLRGNKVQVREGGIRVPFIIRWKGHLPEGKTDSRPIIQLDVMPTALAAAGIRIQRRWRLDGVNLLPFLMDKLAAAPHDVLYWRFGGTRAIRKGDWKLVDMRERQPGTGTSPESILSWSELYNLKDDIGEQKNLVEANPDKVKELGDAWHRWNRELAKPRWEMPPRE